MARKFDLDLLIKRIKAATGLTQEGIADAIRYSRPHFSSMKKNHPEKLYPLLEKHFEAELSSKFTVEEEEAEYQTQKHEEDVTEEKAMLQILLLEMAKVKSKLYDISLEAAMEELEQNIQLALNQIKKRSV